MVSSSDAWLPATVEASLLEIAGPGPIATLVRSARSGVTRHFSCRSSGVARLRASASKVYAE